MAGDLAESRVNRGGPRISFELASEADDLGLRHVLAKTPMEGSIRLILMREPSYFAAAAVEGPLHHVLLARDTATGCVIGMGSRSVRDRFVGGQPAPVGYLSGLRLLQEYRRGTLLARAYQTLRPLCEQYPSLLDVTTIAEGNRLALDSIASGRVGLPVYHPLGLHFTFALPLRGRLRPQRPGPYTIRPLHRADLPALVAFLNEVGSSRLFFPVHKEADFTEPSGVFQSLPISSILTAWLGPRLVATLAGWDQSPFKQTVVAGYARPLALYRPIFNLVACLAGWPRLPAMGQTLKSLMIAIPLSAPGAEDAFPLLLAELCRRTSRRKHDHLLIGVAERDPLLPALRRRALFRYVTRVYGVCWRPDQLDLRSFENHPLYLELGCL